jgi:3',5'-cyclic AMP phosphodiesterase CpdA
MKESTIIHLSDLHIPPKPGQKVNGFDTMTSFQHVMGVLETMEVQPNLFILSGDLADHEPHESYERLRRLLDNLYAFKVPVLLSIGNHDQRRPFHRVMLRQIILDDDHRFYYSTIIDGFKIVILDTKANDGEDGDLDRAQLDWLDAELNHAGEKGTIIVMHHPPLLLDRCYLRNVDVFGEILAQHQVTLILCGHLHKNSIGYFQGIPVAVAPAASFSIESRNGTKTYMDQVGFNLIKIKKDNLVIESIITAGSQPESLDIVQQKYAVMPFELQTVR